MRRRARFSIASRGSGAAGQSGPESGRMWAGKGRMREMGKNLLACLGLALWGACGTPQSWADDGPQTVEVRIEQYRFHPAEQTLKVGGTVRWINQEKRTSHSVLFPGGEESERMLPGESWEKRFDRAGTYPYRCGPHPEMTGRIIVLP